MTELRVAAEVAEAFPALAIAAVVAEDLRAEQPWPETEPLLAALEAAATAGDWRPLTETDPLLATWQEAYRAFGTNPRRLRPSVDALGRRLGRAGRLPRINPAVDAYNAVSVTHGVPVGAFDLAAVRGDILLRFAAPGDVFVPLGEPTEREQARPGEVVYVDQADDAAVLTRHWNHRDSDRSKVTPTSRRVLFLLETVEPDVGPKTLDQAVEQLTGLLTGHAGAVTRHLLTPAEPAARLD